MGPDVVEVYKVHIGVLQVSHKMFGHYSARLNFK